MRSILIITVLATACVSESTFEIPQGHDLGQEIYGPLPAIEVSCTKPDEWSDYCGYIWAYTELGEYFELATIQISGDADPNGEPRIQNADHIWFHNDGEPFVAMWADDNTFDYFLPGPVTWLDPAGCAKEFENRTLSTEGWTCVHVASEYIADE